MTPCSVDRSTGSLIVSTEKERLIYTQKAGFMSQHGAHLGPVGPRWVPCGPHEPCYQGNVSTICHHLCRTAATPCAQYDQCSLMQPISATLDTDLPQSTSYNPSPAYQGLFVCTNFCYTHVIHFLNIDSFHQNSLKYPVTKWTHKILGKQKSPIILWIFHIGKIRTDGPIWQT